MLCDKKAREEQRKKAEASKSKAPAGVKILKRIKLKEVSRNVVHRPTSPAEEENEEVEHEEEEVNSKEAEKDNWEELEALAELEQDRLVEEILRNRSQRKHHSSDVDLDQELEATEVATTKHASEEESAGEGTNEDSDSESDETVSSGDAPGQTSIDTVIKEQILFHGLNKYPKDYDRQKLWPQPDRKKRALEAPSEEEQELYELAHNPPRSTMSSSTGLSKAPSDMYFDLESRKSKSVTEIPAQHMSKLASKSSRGQTAWSDSIVSKLDVGKDPDELTSEDDSITEQLISLDARKKVKTTKERYLPHKPIQTHGQVQCTDETMVSAECLPPGEIVKMAIRPDKLWGIPMNKPLSTEEFIDLMHKIENYSGHGYVYLSYVNPSKASDFNPYHFKVVEYKDVDPKQYFTLSRTGVMHFRNGYSQFTSIVKSIKQIYIYERISKIPFFLLYPIYKCYRVWRSNICQAKMKKNRKQLGEALFMTKRPLQGMLILLFQMIEKISEIGLLSLQTEKTCGVKEFAEAQQTRLELILKRFRAFENMVLELTEKACRTYLVECGFSAENYMQELEYYLRGLKVPVDRLADEAIHFLDYPGQWLPYSLQAKKKKVCERLSNFIHLVDFYVQATYHRLLKNSVFLLMRELHGRNKVVQKEFGEAPKYLAKFVTLKQKNDALLGKMRSSGATNPIFEIGASYSDSMLTFTPTKEKFLKQIFGIFNTWKTGMAEYRNLLPNDTFNPYTKPIVNGYMGEKSCGDGPGYELLYNTDPDLFDVYDTIEMIFNYAFDACKEYVNKYEHIRQFCLENDKFNVAKIRTIEDGEVLTQLLEKYHKQLVFVKEIDVDKNIGIFHVTNGALRENALASVMRIIDVLHDHVPAIGGKCLRALASRVGAAQAKLERYPETVAQYIEYLQFLEEIQEQMEDIEKDLDDCAELADLIEYYEMPASEEDHKGYANIVPLLSGLRHTIVNKMHNRDTLLGELEILKEKALQEEEDNEEEEEEEESVDGDEKDEGEYEEEE